MVSFGCLELDSLSDIKNSVWLGGGGCVVRGCGAVLWWCVLATHCATTVAGKVSYRGNVC